MKKTSFFRTKEGSFSIAFIVIMISFIVEVIGLTINAKGLYCSGFLAILAAIIYSPVKVYLLKKSCP